MPIDFRKGRLRPSAEPDKCEVIFSGIGVVVLGDGSKFYVKYDTGGHQVAMRQDEVSETDVTRIMSGSDETAKVLLEVQQRLIQAGIDPFISNVRE